MIVWMLLDLVMTLAKIPFTMSHVQRRIQQHLMVAVLSSNVQVGDSFLESACPL